jgi:O-antigen/teichoic acid export membrane protein
MFLLAAVFMQAGQCLVTYMRAHKQEPILVPNIVMGILNGLTVWLLGSRFGPIGIGVGYLVQVILGTIWVATIWRHCRMEWHKG